MSKIHIDVNSPDGNPFAILGHAKIAAKALGLEFSEIQEDMVSSDYGHMIDVFMSHFSDFFIIEGYNE